MLRKLKQVRDAVGAHTSGAGGEQQASGISPESSSSSAEGFLCPICMVVQSSPEALQKHYESEHANNSSVETAIKNSDSGLSTDNDDRDERLSEASTDSLGTPAHSVSSVDIESGTHREKGGSVAFTCPQCFQELASAEELQSHFSALHEVSAENRDGDVLAMRMEMSDLRSSIKEEKWYSSELKKELERVQAKMLEQSQTSLSGSDVDEATYLQQQVQALEAGKALVTSRMLDYEKEVYELKRANEHIQREKERIIEKSAYMAKDVVQLKSQVDEENSQKLALGEEVLALKTKSNHLEKLLDQRPSEDDVDVLRKELIHAQTLMDVLTQEKESEIEAFKTNNQQLEIKCQECEKTIGILSEQLKLTAKSDDIQRLQSSVQESSDKVHKEMQEKMEQSAELNLQLEKLKSEFSESKTRCKSLEGELEIARTAKAALEKELEEAKKNSDLSMKQLEKSLAEANDVQVNLRRENEGLKAQVGSLQKQIHDQNEEIEEKTRQILSLESSAAKLRDEMETRETAERETAEKALEVAKAACRKLEQEKADMIAKIQEGQGNLAALSSLSDEKSGLLAQLEKSMSDVKALKQKQKQDKQDNKRLLQDKEADLADRSKKLEECEKRLKSAEQAAVKTESRLKQAQTEIKSLKSQLEASESAKESQRKDLEGHLTTLRGSLKERSSDALELTKQIETLTSQLSDRKETIVRLEVSFEEEREKLKSAIEKLEAAEKKALETSLQLQKLAESYDQLLREKGALSTELEEIRERLKETNEKLTQCSSAYETVSSEKEGLISRVSAAESALKLSEEKYKHLETSCSLSEEDRLQKIAEIQIENEKSLKETYSEMENLAGRLRQMENQLDTEKNAADALKLELENSLRKKETELSESNAALGDLQGTLKLETQKLSEYELEKSKLKDLLSGTEAKCRSLGEELKKITENLKDSKQKEKSLTETIGKQQEDLKLLAEETAHVQTQLENVQRSVGERETEFRNSLVQKEKKIEEAKAELSSVNEKLIETNASLEEERDSCRKLREDCAKLKETVTELEEQGQAETSAANLLELNHKNAGLLQENDVLKENMETLQVKYAENEKQWNETFQQSKKKLDATQADLIARKEMSGDTERRVAELQESLQEAENQFQDQSQKMSKLMENQRKEFENQLTTMSNSLEESNRKLSQTNDQLNKASMEMKRLAEELEEAQKSLDEEKVSHTAACDELGKVTQKLEKESGASAQLTQRRDSLEADLKEKEAVLAELTIKYQEAVQDSSEALRQFEEKEKIYLTEKESLGEALNALMTQKTQLDVNLTDLTEEKDQLEERVRIQEKEFQNRLTETQKEQETVVKAVETECNQQRVTVENLTSKLTDLEQELTLKKEQVLSAHDVNEELKQKFTELQDQSSKSEEKLKNLEFQLCEERKRVGNMTAEAENLRSLDERKTKEIQEKRETIEVLSRKLKASVEELSSVRADVTAKILEIQALMEQKLLVDKTLMEMETNLADKVAENDALKAGVENANSTIEELKLKMEELESSTKSTREKLENTETDLLNRDKAFEEIMAAKLLLEEKLSSTSLELNESKKQLEQHISDSKKRDQGCMEDIKDLKRQLEQSQKDAEQERNSVKQYQEASRTMKADLENRLQELRKELESNVTAKSECEQKLSEQISSLENQNQLLTESLGELRSELGQKQQTVEEIATRHSELAMQKNELETQMSSWKEEKRALLERCLNTERDLEEEKEKSDAIKKRFDDALSAMHDLGREHSSMQVDLSKLFTRKWVDDSEVANCTACAKAFSVTIRKHHCRNCGLIFCTECSSKQANMASAKRPVRVCDGCHQELMAR